MIAVDWGTSSFRAYRLDAAGQVLDQRSAAAGLLACGGVFEPVLARQVATWDDPTILMAGMIGSRSGWQEVPYADCPAGIEALAAGVKEVAAPSLPGRRVWIVPGLAHHPVGAPPEVMRGEETQIFGLPDGMSERGSHCICLPGTHSKWVQLEGGRIVSLRTAMTGELYSLLRQHSLLAALMPKNANEDGDDEAAFLLGVDASRRTGGLLHHLFGVRTQGLFGSLSPAQSPSYLSGLLIGHELQAAGTGTGPVQLVGSAALVRRYQRALAHLGVPTRCHGEALSSTGLHRLARVRGFTL
ncbi:2-keto-3-deoxy-galactonokinase [Burkholderiales bacterium JOSHI_001]|nr:2-keto-3-deoxy-galactonokinase [Burkholderiales bacterium JOSHI_001]